MGAQVGEAFVRIRPNMAGFKSETETGVKSSFSSLAKIAGLAFGGAAVGALIKSSIESAGQTQALAHSIEDTYGRAGKAVIAFSKTTGASFGALETSTQATAVQLGQLFTHAGASSDDAAKMAVGWEKLAVAVNRIRGGSTADAAEILAQITHAAAGTSTRGLSQLGISLNTASIQAQAVADGFLKMGQSSAALTPLQKQQVIFQLAMRQLPALMDTARSHLHDFAAEQARLSVEWDNAKNSLGEALLPLVTKYTTELANWLAKAENSGRLQRDFNNAAHDAQKILSGISSVIHAGVNIWHSFTDAVGGAKNVLIAVAGALALVKARGIGTAVQGDATGLAARIKAHVANIKQAQADAAKGIASVPQKHAAAWAAAARAQTSGFKDSQAHAVAWAAAAKNASNSAVVSLGKVKTAQDAVASSAKKDLAARIAAEESASQRRGPTAEGVARIQAGIDRARAAALGGPPVPKNNAYLEALARQAHDTARRVKDSPFSADWVAGQKKNLASVIAAEESASQRLGPTPAGAARIQAGIDRAKKALLAGQPLPKNDAYLKALAAQSQDTARRIKTSLGGAADESRSKLSRIGTAFAPVAAKAKSATNTISQAATHAATGFTKVRTRVEEVGQKTHAALENMGNSFSKFTGTANTQMTTVGTKTKGVVSDMGNSFSKFTQTANGQSNAFASTVRSASSRAGAAFGAAATGMKIAAIEVGATIKAAIIQTGIGLLVVAIGIAVGYIITHWETVKRYTIALGEATKEVFKGMGEIVVGVYRYIYGKAVYYLLTPIKDFVDEAAKAAGWIPFIGGKLKDAAGAVDSFYASIHHFAEGGRQEILSGVNTLGSGVTKAWSDALKKSADDPSTKKNAQDLGKKTAKDISDAATQSITATAPSVQKAISDALQNAVAAAHKAILAAVQSAKNNLDKIGQDLAKTIDQIQAKIGGAAGAIAGSPQGQAFAKLKKLIESGAPAFEIQKAQAELAGQLQNVGKTQKSQVSTQLANLTAAFNKGDITYKQFEARLHKILKEDGITMAQALKAGGPAFADAFKAQVAALAKQAKAIADTPKKFRGIGGAGGAADIKIIQPLQVIKQEQLKVRTAVEKAAQQAEKQRAAILKAQQKQNALTEQFKANGIKVHWVGPGPDAGRADPTGARHLLDQIRTHTRRTADELQKHTRIRGQHVPRPATHVVPGSRGHAIPVPGRAPARPRQTADTTRTAIKTAITSGHAALLRGLRDICTDIATADKDIVASTLALRNPLENLRRTELRVGEEASRQRDRQYRATVQTNTLLRRLERNKGPVPGFGKERPGTGSKHARKATKAGVKV